MMTRSFAALRPRLDARAAGLAFLPVGSQEVVSLGDWSTGAAWSTIKVPLSMAALKRSESTVTQHLARRALTASDNSAAEALWEQLGGGESAAAAVDEVLRRYGDANTQTKSRRVRSPYSPFGQTLWSLTDQAAFVSQLACATEEGEVLANMDRVIVSQRWGLGTLPQARFKGGWGPQPSGAYLVRQFGVVELDGHQVAIAMAVEPRSGSFQDGVRVLDKMAAWAEKTIQPSVGKC
jgi:hypothetical protein